jgi:hypothetical protein
MLIAIQSLLFVMAVLPQTPGTRQGASGLVIPIVGVPLSLDQEEQRTRILPDGSSEHEAIKSKVYRDSAGRIRTDSTITDQSGKVSSVATIVDPVTRSVVTVLDAQRIAIRMTMPNDGRPFGLALPTVEQTIPPGDYDIKKEDLGKRTILGIECEGSRITQTSTNASSLVVVLERWDAKALGLAVSIVVSGSKGSQSAEIREVQYAEPRAEIFSIPAGYLIREF